MHLAIILFFHQAMTMSNQQHSRLGQILINKGLISAAQLDAAIQAQ
ncbi:hypothetical protein CGQ14_20995, partial [Pseudomonas aeruginosa]